jgi:diketogulonate reductase-like aldo/keto reductase
MRTAPFGPLDRKVAVIGQGAWNIERAPRKQVIAALRAGLDAGATHIDTAEMYGDGNSEDIVGEAIAGRRDEVFLVSKVLPSNASAVNVVKACERTLKHLKVERLDCYLLHWRGRVPLEETFGVFETLKQTGKIAAFGVSNFDADDLDEALAIVGPGALACNQVLYHLQERAIEHRVIGWCKRHRVAVTAYSPFGSGDFPAANSAGGRVLGEIASAHGATARQVALAFLTRDPAVFAIPKAADPAHAADNACAGELTLSADEIARIDSAFPRGPAPRGLPMI